MPAITTVVGNVVRDPEGNDKHVRFTVASNEGYGDRASTSFYKVWVFNGNMDRVKKAIKKGSLVQVILKELKIDTTGKTPELSGVFLDFNFVNSGGRAKTSEDDSNTNDPEWPVEEEVAPSAPVQRTTTRRGSTPAKKDGSIPF